ncbi:hypothetical protein BC937DRAFT_91711 [Endogone sp. FLAS-F59071]|nr:hypothetical protein BC937DRAFT_91711 [Endogone sp. FLAS-F59071]|eukprot:RUS21716.1 hypothetical protein BC937DRAFT_91711 [Endogone sp. FLAS-F59071]
MNSTVEESDSPLPPNDTVVIAIATLGLTFSAISCIAIARKAKLDYSQLRCCCLVLGLMTLILGILNVLRITSQISRSLFGIMAAIMMILFIDFMVAITFSLGSKLYEKQKRINYLYRIAFVATVLSNLFQIARLILECALHNWQIAPYLNTVAHCMLLVALFFAYWYAFYPVVRMSTGVDNTPSAVVAVGVWYLSGMAILILLNLIPLTISTIYALQLNKEISVKTETLFLFLRMAMLDFYSIPPSNKIILAIRRKFFPNSILDTTVEGNEFSSDLYAQHLMLSPNEQHFVRVNKL